MRYILQAALNRDIWHFTSVDFLNELMCASPTEEIMAEGNTDACVILFLTVIFLYATMIGQTSVFNRKRVIQVQMARVARSSLYILKLVTKNKKKIEKSATRWTCNLTPLPHTLTASAALNGEISRQLTASVKNSRLTVKTAPSRSFTRPWGWRKNEFMLTHEQTTWC